MAVRGSKPLTPSLLVRNHSCQCCLLLLPPAKTFASSAGLACEKAHAPAQLQHT